MLTMTGIDPEEDQLTTSLIEIVAGIFELAYLNTGDSEENQEMLSDIKMQFHLISEEVLSLSPRKRTHEKIRLSVIGALDRLGEKYPIIEDADDDELVDSVCNLFYLIRETSHKRNE